MQSKHKTNWWVDIVLFSTFILAFFFDLTGVELHQWIGILVGALAIFHLAMHWKWVKAVTTGFFTRSSGRSRVYYTLDAGIFAGFATIVITGIPISTWVSTIPDNFNTWLDIHIIASVITLIATGLKITLHWRWIEKITSRPVQQASVNPNHLPLTSRREFLKVMTISGAALIFTVGKSLHSLQESVSASALADAATSVEPGQPEASSPTATSTETPQTIATVTQSEAAAPTDSATTALVESDSHTASNSACTIRCRHGCASPGHCGRYRDTNNNNLCDLGECV